ncbi:type-4 ice-structuring protein-like [Scleropages formosus]|nr:type-4 ice-structuring protein-like [Scleropages formosus]
MKFSLIAALVVVLALAQASESRFLTKREAPELEQLVKNLQDMSSTFSKIAEDLVEKLKTHELTGQAQTYLEDGKAQLQPLAEKVQEHLKPLADSMQGHLKPLTDTWQTHMDELWKQIVEHTKSLTSQ